MSETIHIPIGTAIAISLAVGIIVYVSERPNNPADHGRNTAASDSPLTTAVHQAEAQTGAQAVEAHVAADRGVSAIEVKLVQGGVAEHVIVDGQTGRVIGLPTGP